MLINGLYCGCGDCVILCVQAVQVQEIVEGAGPVLFNVKAECGSENSIMVLFDPS